MKLFLPQMHAVETGKDLFKKSDEQAYDDFETNHTALAKYIADRRADVVALQEVWDTKRLKLLLSLINTERAAAGLEAYRAYGAPDWDVSDKTILNAALDEMTSGAMPGAASFASFLAEETHGGTFLLTAYPVTRFETIVYEDCRAEDCAKAKGAVHARVWLGAPPPSCSRECVARGDLFVDVYTTHLNATSDTCENAEKLSALSGWIGASSTVLFNDSAPGGASAALAESVKYAFNCAKYDSDAKARGKQLNQLRDFMEKTAARDRPAVVMGDFNIDGKGLNANDTGPEYGLMLSHLNLIKGQPSVQVPDDQIMNPWKSPYGFNWDVDHTDLIRERYSVSTLLAGTTNVGTFLGKTALDANERFDYILARPPMDNQFDSPQDPPVPQRFMFAKTNSPLSGETNPPAWNRVWPSADGSKGTRQSDHMGVVANLELVPVSVPPRYHPDWPHYWDVRVTSAGTDDSDCVTCGKVDLYPQMKYWACAANCSTQPSGGHDGTTCQGKASVWWPQHSCMSDWAVHLKQVAPAVTGTSVKTALWEDDNGPDDHYDTVQPGTDPIVGMYWPTGKVSVRAYQDGSVVVPHGWKTPDPVVEDNAPIGFCGGKVTDSDDDTSYLCLEMSVTEIPPSEQKGEP